MEKDVGGVLRMIGVCFIGGGLEDVGGGLDNGWRIVRGGLEDEKG